MSISICAFNKTDGFIISDTRSSWSDTAGNFVGPKAEAFEKVWQLTPQLVATAVGYEPFVTAIRDGLRNVTSFGEAAPIIEQIGREYMPRVEARKLFSGVMLLAAENGRVFCTRWHTRTEFKREHVRETDDPTGDAAALAAIGWDAAQKDIFEAFIDLMQRRNTSVPFTKLEGILTGLVRDAATRCPEINDKLQIARLGTCAHAITGQEQYTLDTYIRRGQFGTPITSHVAGEAFLRLDDAVFKYTFDPIFIGKTLYFKFQSVNTFGNAAQDLSLITAVPFTISGSGPGTVDAETGIIAISGMRAAHVTYRPLSNPLTATDAGSNATISIASFLMRVPGISDISLNSGSITALSYDTLYYLYYDDPTYAGGAVTYHATTTKEDALNNTGRFFIGSIKTPVAGGVDTNGNNDGGSGAQYGSIIQIPMSIYKSANHAGNGALNNPQLINDGNTSTFGSLTVTGNSAGNEQSVFLYAAAGFNGPYKSATLKIRRSVPTNSLSSSVINYSLFTGSTADGGATFTSLTQQEHANGGTTIALGVLSVPLSTSQNLSQVCVEIDVNSQSSQSSGSIQANIYGAWIEVVQ